MKFLLSLFSQQSSRLGHPLRKTLRRVQAHPLLRHLKKTHRHRVPLLKCRRLPATPCVTGSQGPVTAATPATGGGNGQVCVNSSTHVYHKEGSRFYGKTKHGKYMSEQDAIKKGDHAAKNEH